MGGESGRGMGKGGAVGRERGGVREMGGEREGRGWEEFIPQCSLAVDGTAAALDRGQTSVYH